MRSEDGQKQLARTSLKRTTTGSMKFGTHQDPVLCDFKMNVVKWQFNLVECNVGLKSYVISNRTLAALPRGGGGDTLGISGWGCAARTLEPLAYTRASSAEFC